MLVKQRAAAAQDLASAGNGGIATASANVGYVVAAGDSWGPLAVDGGVSTSATSVTISASGGVAIADASGGDANFAFVS